MSIVVNFDFDFFFLTAGFVSLSAIVLCLPSGCVIFFFFCKSMAHFSFDLREMFRASFVSCSMCICNYTGVLP